MTSEKTCLECKKSKSIEDFDFQNKASGKRVGRCKTCRSSENKIRYQNNPTPHRQRAAARRALNPDGVRQEHKERYHAHPEADRARKLKKQFGLSFEEYDRMYTDQRGVCKICGCQSGAKRLAVDHCHATGKVRGLLCGNCNTSLGKMKDDPELLRRAALYLESK